MKKRFTMKVMYGDADGFEEFSYITEKEDEMKFLMYFLDNYKDDFFGFYNRPDLLCYNETFSKNEELLISIINTMVLLRNKVVWNCEDPLTLVNLSNDIDISEIHNLLTEIIEFVGEHFGWNLYHSVMDCNGCPIHCKIEDMTGCIEITKERAIKLLKDALNMDVIFID